MHATRSSTLICLLAALVLAPVARAQDDGTVMRPVARNAFTIHALGPWLGIYSAEYARALGSTPMTLGVSATYVSERANDYFEEGYGSDDRQVIADAKLHMYVDRTPFSGLALVFHAGVYADRYRRYDDSPQQMPTGHAWHAAPTLGFSLEYAASRRRRRSPVVVVGAGAKGIFDRDVSQQQVLPMLNVSVGGLF